MPLTKANAKSRLVTVFQDPALPREIMEEIKQRRRDFRDAFGSQPVIDEVDQILDAWVADPASITPEDVGLLFRLLMSIYSELP